MPSADVSLGFMPAFFTRHLGVTYGESYYFDPDYKARVTREEGRFLYELFGAYGIGSPDPQPWPDVFIQPVDLLMHTQGAAWRFPPNATVESVGTPWAGMTPREIDALDPRAAAEHPVIDAILDLYRTLERLYGARADILGAKSGTMNIHTPYTTAHQLCGEGLFMTLLDDPDGAWLIFRKVWEMYRAIYARFCDATGARLTRLYLGDCAASLLSADLYREVVLPAHLRLTDGYATIGYHSCGLSTHLLADFAALPRLDAIELGAGTDLAVAAARLPGVQLRPLVDPVLMREGSADAVADYIGGMLRDAAPAPAVTLCAWSFDSDTPFENVRAMLRVAKGGD